MAPPADIPTTNTRCGSIVHRDASAMTARVAPARNAGSPPPRDWCSAVNQFQQPCGLSSRDLLGVRDDEAVAVRLPVEQRAGGERRRGLGAAVERDDERRGRRRVEAVGDVDADGSRAAAVVVLDHVGR